MARLTSWIACAALLALVLGGCKETSSPARPAAPGAAVIPAGLIVTAPAPEASPLADVKAAAKVGDTVTFKALIGGREAPFTEGRAMFMVADPRLKPCNARPGDTCPTPWDFCCESAEDLRAKTAVIQVVDSGGRVVKAEAKGFSGLEPLALVVVEGVVAERDESGNFVVNARHITVAK